MKRVAEVLPALTRLVCAGDKGAHERCCVNFASLSWRADLMSLEVNLHEPKGTKGVRGLDSGPLAQLAALALQPSFVEKSFGMEAHERCCVNFASVLLTMSTDVHNN